MEITRSRIKINIIIPLSVSDVSSQRYNLGFDGIFPEVHGYRAVSEDWLRDNDIDPKPYSTDEEAPTRIKEYGNEYRVQLRSTQFLERPRDNQLVIDNIIEERNTRTNFSYDANDPKVKTKTSEELGTKYHVTFHTLSLLNETKGPHDSIHITLSEEEYQELSKLPDNTAFDLELILEKSG